MKELSESEKKFLEDLIRYSNEVFGEGSKKALTEGAPVTYKDVEKRFERVLEEEKEYDDVIESLIGKNVLEKKTREKEVHKKEDGRNVREMEEWEYLAFKEPETLQELEIKGKGEK